jgi:hypothetical protein
MIGKCSAVKYKIHSRKPTPFGLPFAMAALSKDIYSGIW